MALKQARVFVEDLQKGMFVSRLDKPWTQTPFALQGFYIRDREEIRQLQHHCRYVYVDIVKSVGDAGVALRRQSSSASGINKFSAKPGAAVPVVIPCRPVKVSHNSYPEPAPLKREAFNAARLHKGLHDAMQEVMVQLDAEMPLPVQQVTRSVEEMVDSVLRSPDAFSWLARIRSKDEYTYAHSIRAGIWAIVFGRHIGLARRELVALGVATLLKDVGKTRLPDDLLKARQRSSREELEFRTFIRHSVDILTSIPDIDPDVLNIVLCHRELHDGSGYPRGLRGDQVPVLARMCGIVSFYDEATNPRGAEFPVAPSRAVSRLYDLRGRAFQEQLALEFIQSIGIYPTGTQVELSSGEIGVVVEQTFHNRLHPKVMVVLDANKQLLARPRLIDLLKEQQRRQSLLERGKVNAAGPAPLSITKDVEPGVYPTVKVGEIRDQYMFHQQKKTLLGALLGR
ncbi:HD-GYP domain-containing protein [Biformimicrobium ophioploci]|uniref:HD-GYP domain-containing protein n=1 Tax=Biformimicrobium ophioploci TaxID=3036711 RepID=A0ABQ6LUX5_9GAMM|nr:HD-GYP domain-containing protein [Microbulbifer sp. NKW57]GMG85893.1 HD-GYP domain-containing protein [Microbulbifer sp. NKW57]